MNITFEVPAPAKIPFKRYAAALESSIGETYANVLHVDDINIVRAEAIRVLFDGEPGKGAAARDIAKAARWYAKPSTLADYFA